MYTTWYLVELNGAFAEQSHFKICKTEMERDEYVAELCKMLSEMGVDNTSRPRITIRVDRHFKPNGGLIR